MLQEKLRLRIQKEKEAADLAKKHAVEPATAAVVVITPPVQVVKPAQVVEQQAAAMKPVKQRAPRPKPAPDEPADEPATPRETGARGFHVEFLRGLYETVTGKRNRDMTRKELDAWLREYKDGKVIYLII